MQCYRCGKIIKWVFIKNMIFINYHLIKLELRQYHPDMEFLVDGLRR